MKGESHTDSCGNCLLAFDGKHREDDDHMYDWERVKYICKHNRSLKVTVLGPEGPTPYTFIQVYMHIVT